MSFAITVLPAVHGHRWVLIEGHVTAASATDIRAMIATALREPAPRRLTIDARHAHIDQAGRACLVDVSDAATDRGILVQLLESKSEATCTPEPYTSTGSTPLLVAS